MKTRTKTKMRTTMFVASLTALSMTAQASVPAASLALTRVHLSTLSAASTKTAQTTGSVGIVPNVDGVEILSRSEASHVRGKFLQEVARDAWAILSLGWDLLTLPLRAGVEAIMPPAPPPPPRYRVPPPPTTVASADDGTSMGDGGGEGEDDTSAFDGEDYMDDEGNIYTAVDANEGYDAGDSVGAFEGGDSSDESGGGYSGDGGGYSDDGGGSFDGGDGGFDGGYESGGGGGGGTHLYMEMY